MQRPLLAMHDPTFRTDVAGWKGEIGSPKRALQRSALLASQRGLGFRLAYLLFEFMIAALEALD